MVHDYTPTDPQALIQRITAEAYSILELLNETPAGESEDQTIPVDCYLTGLALVGKAWGLQSEAESALKTLNHFAQGQDTELREDACTPMNEQILTALWGLFDTAVRLESQEEREQIRALAQEIMDFHALDVRLQTP